MSALPQEVVDELVSFVRRLAEPLPTRMAGDWITAEKLVAKLPPPVDPDIEEARKLLAEWGWDNPDGAMSLDLVTQALKRGRTLQQEESSNG